MTRAKERLQYQLALELLEELVRAGLLTTQEGEYAKQLIEVKYCLLDIQKCGHSGQQRTAEHILEYRPNHL